MPSLRRAGLITFGANVKFIEDRKVAETRLPSGVRVSTVFLDLIANPGEAPPTDQWETLIIQSVAGGQAPLINGGSSMSNNAKKSQASVMLVFPGPDGRRYRIVSFVGGDPSRVEKYVLDEEREDTVGDKFWQPTTTWVLSSDLKLQDILMSAILYLMNPNALIANDAELEGRKADAATITAQPADKRKKGL